MDVKIIRLEKVLRENLCHFISMIGVKEKKSIPHLSK